MMMSELFEISASIRETKAPSVANDRAIVIKDGVDNHHHQHQHDDDAEEECVELANEEVKVNLTNGAEEKCASNSDRRMEEVIKNGENFQLIGSDQLISAISIETNGEAQRARSLECQSARTVSESPPGATDSWKNATVNMNHSIPIPITHSAHNTTPRSHQTKVIFNNEALNLGEVIHHHPLFVKNTSKYWYKPAITREEAVSMLRDKPPGTFVVRDSNSFPGAFGLALKVSTPPPGVNPGDGTELVRHFLIEPSPKGVKLRGCNNEPVFGTLSALVYQHSIIPLALPTKLLLPEYDPANTPEHISAAQQLLQQGAACNVTYVISLDTESLTGPEAVRRCIDQSFELLKQKMIHPVPVHFKVSSQGITITDNTRQLFFRRHYPVQSVTYAGLDPSDRRWDNSYLDGSMTKYVRSARILAFVARKIGSRTDNTCHIFAELEPEQPATAVVNFITKVMMGCK
ncbi:unnamed protein product [Litomosoides sigmodontis]|uniref:SH2 domain-containing protein n=1 Tax=Litomosoides sigmodontis TaxID=42156 RepID=A0A3P7JM79_LITSI|nr:unnamed protein product [Litomosoides sigmodontis]